MIFVTVGTQLPFDRLIRGMDVWAKANPGVDVIAQTGRLGSENYVPENMEHAPSFDPETFDAHCQNAQLIVAHAGTGTLMKAQACATPLLMMPRQAQLGEHRNDHQVAMANGFRDKLGLQLVFEEDALPAAVDAQLAGDPQPPQLQELADDTLIAALRTVIFDAT